MKDGFERFLTSVTLAHKYVQYIKKREGLVFGLKGFNAICLYFLSKYPEGVTITDLSKRCCEDKSTVSRAVDSLIKKGYVARQYTVSGSRRGARMFLTADGKKVAQKVERLIRSITKKIGEGFTQEQIEEFYRTFTIMDKRLAEYCGELEKREKQRNARQ